MSLAPTGSVLLPDQRPEPPAPTRSGPHGVTVGPTRVVLARSASGFVLSNRALARLAELGHAAGVPGADLSALRRDDPTLVRVLSELGDDASGPGARLVMVIVPARTGWRLEFDGSCERLTRFRPKRPARR